MKSEPREFQLGIDIISLDRSRDYLKRHGRPGFEKILSESEHQELRKKPLSAQLFAKKFSAKEAYFKSLNASWFGVDGFQKIEVIFKGANQFTAYQRKSGRKVEPASGNFIFGKGWIAAKVLRWQDKSQNPNTKSQRKLKSSNAKFKS